LEISLNAVKYNSENFQYVPQELYIKDKDDYETKNEILLNSKEYFINKYPWREKGNYYLEKDQANYWKNLPKIFFEDFDFLKKVLQKNHKRCSQIQYFPLRLRNDKQFVEFFMKNEKISWYGSNACEYCPKFKKSKEILLLTLNTKNGAREVAMKNYFDDEELFLKAIQFQPLTFSQHSKFLKSKELVIKILKLKNFTYKKYHLYGYQNHSETFIPSLIKDFVFTNEELLDIIKSNGYFIHFLNLKEFNREFLLEAVKYSTNILKMNFEFDDEMLTEIMTYKGNNLKFASKEIKKNEKLVLLALKNSNVSIRYVSSELRSNKEFMTKVIDKRRIKFVTKELKDDKELFWKSKKYFKFIRDINIINIKFNFI